jgi:hypothetical protein
MELTAAALIATGALGFAGLGLSIGTAAATVGPLPEYHWCPGQDFDPGWGNNWDSNVCHDDFHRDNDGYNHDNDYRPGDDYQRGGDYRHGDDYYRGGPPPDQGPPGNYYVPPGYNGPPPPPGGWQPSPFCIPFVTCAPT